MIDKQAILERADLLSLAEHDTDLGRKPVATTQGGEWAGPCPFCGGVDRFRVQPNRRPWGLWMCRQCTGGKWRNAIDYVIRRDGCDFKTACATLAGGDLPTTRERREPSPRAADSPSGGEWQAQAWQVIEICQKNLLTLEGEGERGLDWLLGRGLSVDTIEYYRLGYSPGAKFGKMYVPRGVVIPCIVAGEVWYLKISLLPGDPVKCGKCKQPTHARQPCPSCGEMNKYRGVKGNRTAAIFGADDLAGADMALFVEGEIDVMTAWQALGGSLPVATMGSANNHPDLATWGPYLIGLRHILVNYDQDKPGESGAKFWAGLTDRARFCRLPEGVKDINDFYTGGGDLRAWLDGEIDRLGLLAGEVQS